MRIRIFIALVCLCCLCICTVRDAQACTTYHVPGDAATIPEALIMAQAGDTIEVALGRHKIVGRNHVLKAGVTIRSSNAPYGACVLEEAPRWPGDWRDAPVFVLDEAGAPCRMENLSFQHWTLSDGPYQTIECPVIHVVSGAIEFDRCQWQDTYKQVLYFSGGTGSLEDCQFAEGRGYPAAISFGGDELSLVNCNFLNNSWVMHDGMLQGSLIRLRSGQTYLTGCMLSDNGPLTEVLVIERAASLIGDQACLACNTAIWEAYLAGSAYLNCCEVVPHLWHVVAGGELIMVEQPNVAKAMAVESASWSQVKSLFD